MKKNILMTVSTPILSGAEYVTGDFLRDEKSNTYYLLMPDNEKVIEYFAGFVPRERILTDNRLRFRDTMNASGIVKLFRILQKFFFMFGVRRHQKKLIRTLHIDVLYGHNTQDILFIPNTPVPVILQVYDNIPEKSLLRWMIRRYGSRIDQFIADAESVARGLINSGIKRERIHVIYNGLPPKTAIPRSTLTGNASQVALTWIGSFEERKNPVEFFRILSLLSQTDINMSANLVYRRTDKSYYQLNFQKEKENSNGINISYYENIPREKLNEIYQNTDILFCTSLDDPLPSVILEGFAYGIPSIARKIEGVDEMITDNENGFLYKNIDEVPVMVRGIIGNYKKFSGNALSRIENQFSQNKKVKTIMEIIENPL